MMKHIHRDQYWYHEFLVDIGKGTSKAETNDEKDAIAAVERELIRKVYIDVFS